MFLSLLRHVFGISMIVICQDGRLGNQLFQYAVMKSKFPLHQQLLIGFDDTEKVMSGIQAKFISRALLPNWISPERIRKLLHLLARLRLIGVVTESTKSGVYLSNYRPGLFRSLITLNSTYFQDQSQLLDLKPDFYIRDELITEAKEWLKINLPKGNFSNLVFVHVRRGDYLTWPTSQHPAVLSVEWYKNQINRLEKELDSPCFIVITDDYKFVIANFESQPNVIVSSNSPEVDFALMTLCNSGVLSASSFAWWGGWLSDKSHLSTGIYLAPKYWAGHPRQEWFPIGFKSDWITYI